MIVKRIEAERAYEAAYAKAYADPDLDDEAYAKACADADEAYVKAGGVLYAARAEAEARALEMPR